MDGPRKKSRKPSVTNSSRPLDDVVFFIDRSLGRKAVAEALRAAGAQVEVHDDHLPQNAKDETWLEFVGQRNWVVLTHDDRIRYRYAEQSALLAAKVRTFVLAAKGLRAEDNAAILVKALPKILRTLHRYTGPFIARIGRSSDVALLFGQRRKRRP